MNNKYYLDGREFTSPPLKSGLYIVATPIGNLKDISLRALEILSACDLILCEDTRTSAKLLNHYGIKTKKMALHEHNENAKIKEITKYLNDNKSIALISDAGTPLISDPGFPLIRALKNENSNIFTIPGASALLAALTISALPTDRFSFFGFLPAKAGAKTSQLKELQNFTHTMVFYESPRRLLKTILAMRQVFGDERKAVIALELTKKFERSMHGNLQDLAIQLDGVQIKGEAVILIKGADEIIIDDNIWKKQLSENLDNMPLRTAVDETTQKFLLKRKQVYDYALNIKKTKI